jgi:protein-tyrosine-phosphatase/peptidoglycan/xylan/chitin deacetylase (PgdA/CDA1 family)
MLHRIANEDAQISGINEVWFDEAIKSFKSKGFKFITLEDFKQHIETNKPFSKKSLLITIDDGYADQVDKLVPICLQNGVKPVVFLISDLIEHQELPWDQRIRYVIENTTKEYILFDFLNQKLHYYFDSLEGKTWARRDLTARCELLSKEELKKAITSFSNAAQVEIPKSNSQGFQAASIDRISALSHRGVNFCNHTSSHLILASNDEKTCCESINKAKKFLKKNKLETSCFAYPIGKPHSIFASNEIVEMLDISIAFTSIEGIVSSDTERLLVPRIPFPINKKQLNKICSPLSKYRYDEDNWLIKIHDLYSLKILVNTYGGKAAALVWLKHQSQLLLGKFRQYRKIDKQQVKRVVFFCKGNINRSAIAATIFNKHSPIECYSFGLKTQQGFPPSVESQRWTKSRGISITHHKTNKVEEYKPRDGDLLVSFEPDHLIQMKQKIDDDNSIQHTLLGLWSRKPWAYIHDPVARPEKYIDKCFTIIEAASRELARTLNVVIK